MTVQPIPEGYHTVTPYLVIPGIAQVLDFLKRAFGAVETTPPMKQADGTVMHAEVQIGDSRVMMGEPMGQPPVPAMLHLYVTDVDSVFRRAVEAGGVVVREPADQFYGDRSGGVKDSAGNIWWIATHKEDVSPEEMMRRMASAGKK